MTQPEAPRSLDQSPTMVELGKPFYLNPKPVKEGLDTRFPVCYEQSLVIEGTGIKGNINFYFDDVHNRCPVFPLGLVELDRFLHSGVDATSPIQPKNKATSPVLIGGSLYSMTGEIDKRITIKGIQGEYYAPLTHTSFGCNGFALFGGHEWFPTRKELGTKDIEKSPPSVTPLLPHDIEKIKQLRITIR